MGKTKREVNGNKYSAGSTNDDTEIEMAPTNDGNDTTQDEQPELHAANNFKMKRHWGASLCFFYVKGEPLFTVGPHCKKLSIFVVILG